LKDICGNVRVYTASRLYTIAGLFALKSVA
jgi:hypothetical protein